MSQVISAVFDNREEARRAVTELRDAGIPENAISLVGRPDDADSIDEDDGAGKGSIAGAVAGGGVAGALLGVAALAIPGVGPLRLQERLQPPQSRPQQASALRSEQRAEQSPGC